MFAVTFMDQTQEFSTRDGADAFVAYLAARGVSAVIGAVIDVP